MCLVCLLSIFNSRPFFCFSPPLKLGSPWPPGSSVTLVSYPYPSLLSLGKRPVLLERRSSLALLLSLSFSPFITCPRAHSRPAQVWAPKMQSSELPLRSGWAGPYPVLVQRPTEKGFAAVLPPGISKPWRPSFCFFASPSEKRVGS